MATIPSNYTGIQTSSPGTRIYPGGLVTAVTPRRPVSSLQPAPRVANLFMLPNEPEDARLTGGTRSLDRRLLALNLSGSLKKPVLAESGQTKSEPTTERGPAPIHSTAA
jgi:hypothetical protein